MSVNAPLTESISLRIGPDEVLSVGVGIREKAAPWLLSLGVLLVYLSFPTRSYYWDGIDFALAIENSRGLSASLIHPHYTLRSAHLSLVLTALFSFSATWWKYSTDADSYVARGLHTAPDTRAVRPTREWAWT